MNKSCNKMTSNELIGLLHFRTRGGAPPSKKGKGSYNRSQFKKGKYI